MQLPTSISSAIGVLLLLQIVQSAPNDGKYNPRKYNKNGKYVHRGEDYVEDLSRYKYVHYDDGDRGRYFHIHIPYDGGYGNYEGGHEPYRFPPYDPTGEYAELISKYSSDPFKTMSTISRNRRFTWSTVYRICPSRTPHQAMFGNLFCRDRERLTFR
ncbi:uncharacterized protein LOC118457626 isoform X2 [Anopheles albimanus]|uniref:uncharacterized protein LOC118457626 isoform X2 n=1 Tax=Anopheles albimanus TaxID=7167 RepID=UPI0016409AB8|nr:uncharacterized protein LOC118457626 isoform X2 [Anopheles albimanus]